MSIIDALIEIAGNGNMPILLSLLWDFDEGDVLIQPVNKSKLEKLIKDFASNTKSDKNET